MKVYDRMNNKNGTSVKEKIGVGNDIIKEKKE